MVSIKDFARDFGVSYEAVRKQIKRYEDELQGHIHRQGRTQYLDDVAVAFLSEHRAPAPVAIYTEDAMLKKIQELEAEVKGLLTVKADQAEKIAELSEWKAEKALAIAEANQTRLALEAAEAAQKDLEADKDEALAEAARNAQKASEEAQRAEQAEREAQELRIRLEAAEAREKALEDKQREFDALPFWKKPFWKGERL